MRKKLLKEAFLAKEVETTLIVVFVICRYVQQAGFMWRREHRIRYQSYRVPENHYLPDVIAFVYEDSTDYDSEKAALFSEKSLDQQECD